MKRGCRGFVDGLLAIEPRLHACGRCAYCESRDVLSTDVALPDTGGRRQITVSVPIVHDIRFRGLTTREAS